MPRAEDTRSGMLVGISFPDIFRAQEFLTASQRLVVKGDLALNDAVTVVKAADGGTLVHETIDPSPGRSALGGALWTGLIGGLVGGPVGWAAGIALGAAGGAARAKVVDLGVTDEWVSWFREAVQPDTATVILLVTEFNEDALVAEVKRFAGATIVYSDLEHRTLERLREALDQHDQPLTSADSATAPPPEERPEDATAEP